jgi:hypothetical protein
LPRLRSRLEERAREGTTLGLLEQEFERRQISVSMPLSAESVSVFYAVAEKEVANMIESEDMAELIATQR